MTERAKIIDRLPDVNLPGLAYLYTRTPFLFQVVDQICRAIYNNHPASEFLPRPQYLYLRLLAASGPITQISLAQLGGIDTSTLSSVLGRLATKRHIEKIRNPMNGRENLVAMTPDGFNALTHAEAAFLSSERCILSTRHVDGTKLRTLIELVARAPSGGAPEWQPNAMPDADAEKLGALFQSPIFLIRRAHQRFDAAILSGASPFDLTLRQYAALLVLYFHAEMTEANLCHVLGYDASNAALVIGVLVGKGLAAWVNQQPRIRKRYSLTRAGRDLLLTKEPALQRVEREGLHPLSDIDIDTLRDMLAAIICAHSHHMRHPLKPFDEVRRSPHWLAPRFAP